MRKTAYLNMLWRKRTIRTEAGSETRRLCGAWDNVQLKRTYEIIEVKSKL